MYSSRRPLWPLLLTVAAAMPFGEEFWLPNAGESFVLSALHRKGPIQEPSELRVVDSVFPMKQAEGQSLSSSFVEAIRAAAIERSEEHKMVKRATSGVVPFGAVGGSIFTVPVTIGGQSFQMVVDTGSSDPWVASSTFQCLDVPTSTQEPQAYCSFGPLYDQTKTSTYSQVANQNFNVSYADHENLNGVMAFETFTLGGITVAQQKFGLVTQAAWYGDSVSSGLIGFAYSGLTNAYAGNDPTKDVKGQQMPYNSVFKNMYTQKLVAPIFSIAMSRNSTNNGLMAIGGIPNVPHSPLFVTVPIQPVGINATTGEYVYSFYSVYTEGFAWSASQSAQFNVAGTNNPFKTNLVGNGTQVIIDSGTSLCYVPNTIAAGFASSFNPPANYDPYEGAYSVLCSATAPLFGVSIGKKIFYVNPADMLIPGPNYGYCYLGIQPNMGGLTIMGVTWLKSVLAVFDIGAEQMRFAAREFTDTPPCTAQGCPGIV